jgi:hypothetical protein
MKKEFVKIINYENINLVQSNREAELIADISARTGINVHRISIQKTVLRTEKNKDFQP